MLIQKNEWYVLSRTPEGVFRLERLAKPFDRIEDLPRAHDALLAELETQRPRALLVDLRNAPLRHDADFERSFGPYRARISRGAPRVAVLVKSKVGALQVQRLAKTDFATAATAFDDEQAALRWLLSPSGKPPPA